MVCFAALGPEQFRSVLAWPGLQYPVSDPVQIAMRQGSYLWFQRSCSWNSSCY